MTLYYKHLDDIRMRNFVCHCFGKSLKMPVFLLILHNVTEFFGIFIE